MASSMVLKVVNSTLQSYFFWKLLMTFWLMYATQL